MPHCFAPGSVAAPPPPRHPVSTTNPTTTLPGTQLPMPFILCPPFLHDTSTMDRIQGHVTPFLHPCSNYAFYSSSPLPQPSHHSQDPFVTQVSRLRFIPIRLAFVNFNVHARAPSFLHINSSHKPQRLPPWPSTKPPHNSV